MKDRVSKDEEKAYKIDGSILNTSKKKNLQRLGGTGVSLEAFANAKSTNKQYNPAFKKKQREFYKNAKYVSKYKKSLKQQNQQNDNSATVKSTEDQNKTRDGDKTYVQNKKKNRKKQSLEELYKKKRGEVEQARMESEAISQAKKEEREKAEAQRKEIRTKIFKKTQYGQPVMKYRIEHLLQTIQGSNKN